MASFMTFLQMQHLYLSIWSSLKISKSYPPGIETKLSNSIKGCIIKPICIVAYMYRKYFASPVIYIKVNNLSKYAGISLWLFVSLYWSFCAHDLARFRTMIVKHFVTLTYATNKYYKDFLISSIISVITLDVYFDKLVDSTCFTLSYFILSFF